MLRWLRALFGNKRAMPVARAAPTSSRPASTPPSERGTAPAAAAPAQVTIEDIHAILPRKSMLSADPIAVEALVDYVLGSVEMRTFEFPAFPATSLRLMELVDKPTVDLNEIVRALHWEPAAVTEILRVASSVRFAALGEFEDLRSAVFALGTAEVAAIAVAVGARTLFEPASKAAFALFPGLWKAAHHEVLAVSFTASWLATQRKVDRPDRVFLRAMIAQTGRMLALRAVAAEVIAHRCTLPLTPTVEGAIDDAQTAVLNVALARWALPEAVTALLDPTRTTEHAIVDLAMALAELLRAPSRTATADRVRERMIELGLDASWLKVLVREHDELVQRARAMG